MEAYAVIRTGGKQYLVKKGDTLEVERVAAEKGAAIEFTDVLARHDGATFTVGAPLLDGPPVKAAVVEQVLGEKLVSFKKKRRKGYSRKVGHRQNLTVVTIAELA